MRNSERFSIVRFHGCLADLSGVTASGTIFFLKLLVYILNMFQLEAEIMKPKIIQVGRVLDLDGSP